MTEEGSTRTLADVEECIRWSVDPIDSDLIWAVDQIHRMLPVVEAACALADQDSTIYTCKTEDVDTHIRNLLSGLRALEAAVDAYRP